MTIQEAIRTGRPFRRPKFAQWFTDKSGLPFWLSAEDFLAEDWEIKPSKIPPRPDLTGMPLSAATIALEKWFDAIAEALEKEIK